MNFKNEKISFLSTEPKMKRAEIIIFLEKKIIEFQDIINETIISVQTYKRLDIIGVSELNSCISTLENLYSLATSQGLRDGISKEQLVARGEKAKNIVDKNIAQTVFDSCFHI